MAKFPLLQRLRPLLLFLLLLFGCAIALATVKRQAALSVVDGSTV